MPTLNTQIILTEYLGFEGEKASKILAIVKTLNITTDDFLYGNLYSTDPYTEDEQKDIARWLVIVANNYFANSRPETREFVTTAGGPGTGKGYYFKNNINNPDVGLALNPDDILPMLPGYQEDLKEYGLDYAYAKWRAASVYIDNMMVALSIYHGIQIQKYSCFSSPRVINMCRGLCSDEIGYSLKIALFLAKDEDRLSAVKHRIANGGHMTIESDVIGMNQEALKRIKDCYFSEQHIVDVFVQRGEFWLGKGITIHAATFNKGSLSILDSEAIAYIIPKINNPIAEDVLSEWIIYDVCLKMLESSEEDAIKLRPIIANMKNVILYLVTDGTDANRERINSIIDRGLQLAMNNFKVDLPPAFQPDTSRKFTVSFDTESLINNSKETAKFKIKNQLSTLVDVLFETKLSIKMEGIESSTNLVI